MAVSTLKISVANNLKNRPIVNKGRTSLAVTDIHKPNKITQQAMEDTLAGKNLSRVFSSVDEMWEELNA